MNSCSVEFVSRIPGAVASGQPCSSQPRSGCRPGGCCPNLMSDQGKLASWLSRRHDGRRPRFMSWTHSRLAPWLVGTVSARLGSGDRRNALASDARVLSSCGRLRADVLLGPPMPARGGVLCRASELKPCTTRPVPDAESRPGGESTGRTLFVAGERDRLRGPASAHGWQVPGRRRRQLWVRGVTYGPFRPDAPARNIRLRTCSGATSR